MQLAQRCKQAGWPIRLIYTSKLDSIAAVSAFTFARTGAEGTELSKPYLLTLYS
jgi:hypothetical protein